MLERGRGHVVTISSDAGREVFPGLAVYSASKFFVEALSRGLRLETAGTGLKVTTVQPGNVATDLVSLSVDRRRWSSTASPPGRAFSTPRTSPPP
jgi:NADP-dependent 3-hydroxy acid dehydrogenase YdfG